MTEDRSRLPPLVSSDWEQRYQTGNTGWDKGTHHPLLNGRFPKDWEGKQVLVPGVGKGHDAHRLATVGAVVTGLDFAPTAIKTAEATKVRNNQSFIIGDVLNPPKELREQFDIIWEHTCFCALAPSQWRGCLESYQNMLKPGGRLVGVFYLSTKDNGNGPPFKIDEDHLRNLLAEQFTIVEWRAPDQTFPGRIGEEVFVRAGKTEHAASDR